MRRWARSWWIWGRGVAESRSESGSIMGDLNLFIFICLVCVWTIKNLYDLKSNVGGPIKNSNVGG